MPPYAALYSPERVYTHPAIPIGPHPHGQGVPSSPAISYDLLKSSGTKYIMVGDPKQLPATVLSNVARQGILLSCLLSSCKSFEESKGCFSFGDLGVYLFKLKACHGADFLSWQSFFVRKAVMNKKKQQQKEQVK
ncbi:hypothetical protein HN51_005381 [Arachis hypogaea]